MGHLRKRPFVGTTPVGVGATYIIIESALQKTNINVIANGTVTFTVDSTLENITYDAAGKAAVNVVMASDPDRYVAPTDATWTEQIASTSSDAVAVMSNEPVFAIRIDITAGAAGSVTYTIVQA